MSPVCAHLDRIELTELPYAIAGCDSSPDSHASAHARATEHPIVRSAEPGETWSWCYVDQVAFIVEAPDAA
jgi:hypothetical protein